MQVVNKYGGFWLKVGRDENGPFRTVRDALETYQEIYEDHGCSIEDLAILVGAKVT